MFSVARESVLDKYAPFLQASSTTCSYLFAVVSGESLSETARAAFSSSAEALGYGKAGCFFITLNGQRSLEPKEAFELIEGIDPLVMVVADKAAANVLSLAYRTAEGPRVIEPLKVQAILGRDSVVFDSFEGMLGTAAAKQRAWALLKKLPHLGS